MVKLNNEYKKFKGNIFYRLLWIKRLIRQLSRRKIYHVIGDSHVLNFLHEAFVIHHIGPATAYKLNSDISTTRSKQKVIKILNTIYNKKNMNVIFVFGEIDTRIHINKTSIEKRITLNRAVQDTVNHYISFLKFIKQEYPEINIYVFNVLPQGEEENIYNIPHYASIERRGEIAKKMNLYLNKQVVKKKFKFVNIYNNLIDKKGRRKSKFIFDKVHYNKKIIPFILDALNTK